MSDTILLFQFGDLGDTILTVPALRAIRGRFPSCRMVLVGKQAAAEFIGGLDLVDDVIMVDKHLFDRAASMLHVRPLLELARVVMQLRKERASTAVLFHHLVTRWGSWKFALLLLASGARRRLGVDNGRGWFLTEAVRDRGFGSQHECRYWLEVAGLLGADGEPTLEAPISAADRQRATELLADAGGSRLLAIHPGAGWYGPGRRWEPGRFVEAARLLMERAPMICVVVGTWQEASDTQRVADGLGGCVLNLTGKTSVGVLGAVLERCELLLSTDGGVAHLAAAVGTPAITVFGPSNDLAWRPLVGEVVAADLPCRPCFYRDFERGLPAGCATRECMEQVTAAMVAARAAALLEEPALAR